MTVVTSVVLFASMINFCNRLLGVLLRFRQENIAVTGDTEKMFDQVKVATQDRYCFRFSGSLKVICRVSQPRLR